MNETSMILTFIGIFLAGGFIGFAIYHISLGRSRAGSKQKELDDTKAELEQYKEKVNNHFMNSADLMQKVATSYQALHTHMATESESLLSEQSTSPYPLLESVLPASQEKTMLDKHSDTEQAGDTNADNTETNEPVAQNIEKTADVTSPEPHATQEKASEPAVEPVEKPLDYAPDNGAETPKPAASAKNTVQETTDSGSINADSVNTTKVDVETTAAKNGEVPKSDTK